MSALPPRFRKELRSKETSEGRAITLYCEVTKAKASVEWRKGRKILQASDKCRFIQEGLAATLVIDNVDVKDSGEYTCICGDHRTTASLTVIGKEHCSSHPRCPSTVTSTITLSTATPHQ